MVTLLKVKKLCPIFIAIVLILQTLFLCPKVNANSIDVSAEAAVLINADTSEILYSKNQDKKMRMASTTKIMTALLTLEHSNAENREITITDKMVPVEGSSMGLHVGDKLSLYGLAQGMLLVSGNDAAHSAAIAISGSQEEFAKLMNEKAKQIGMKNTNFVTPSGLDDDEHYSTAYDMALLGASAVENQSFEGICSKTSMNIEFSEPSQSRTYYNSNKLLKTYDGCIGMKTGFTKKSGRCLVSCARRNGTTFVCVTLNDPNDWKDHAELLDYGFDSCTKITLDESNINLKRPVVGGVKDEVSIEPLFEKEITIKKSDENKIKREIRLPSFVYAPITKGQILGSINYSVDGKTIAQSNLISDEEVKFEQKSIFSYFIKTFFE
jgi:D-alanyl-D-alanine carboxypeptidase/D-alanyl-D-alanine carboxypeptidase (penicillin-binding protein 5/6)